MRARIWEHSQTRRCLTFDDYRLLCWTSCGLGHLGNRASLCGKRFRTAEVTRSGGHVGLYVGNP